MGDDLSTKRVAVENDDLGFVATFKAESHVVNFQIFREVLNGGNGKELELYASGGLKWDGCVNMTWHTEDCMAHFCGRKDAIETLTAVMNLIYELGPELKENWRPV